MYYLLPFRFHVFRNQELLTNDLGDYLLLPRGSVQRIVDREVLPEEELYKNLTASFFIYEKPLPRLIDTMAVRLATRKAFLDHFTALHIFVLTLRCNQNCIYCQASSQESCRNEYDMSEHTLLHAVDLMFRLSRLRLTARCTCTTTTGEKRTAISVLLPVLQRLAKNWAKAGFPH